MSMTVSEFQQHMRTLIRRELPPHTITLYKVKEVNKDKGLVWCESPIGDADRLECRLKAVVNDDDTSFILYPKVGSFVMVACADSNVNYNMIIMVSEVESWKLVVEDNKLSADQDKLTAKWKKWQHNDGSNGGMVKVQELTDKLNALEKAFNAHLTKFNTHTHICAAPTNASTVTSVLDTTNLSLTQKSDLENPDVTH